MIVIRSNLADLRHARDGVTIIELLIVACVIGLLLAMLLPGVQAARESSRRAACQNNLKQVGLALQGFESRNGRYPNAFCGVVDWPDAVYKLWCASPSAQLVAFLDDAARAAQIDGERRAHYWNPAKLRLDAPVVLRCPSDSLASGQAASYRFCRGLLPIYPGDPGGVFTAFISRRPSDVTDGLSNTAFASERLIGSTPGTDLARDPLLLPNIPSIDIAPNCIAANQGGGNVLPPVSGARPMGTMWASANWVHCVYYHLFPPNTPWRDCMRDSGILALVSARSNHRGGVNLLYGDGRVQLAANDVDISVWRAWATRAGGESL